ncbi:MAG: endonuclease [Flavobacteriales bacterium]|nr:endonuclease [Flavobacteriales bacterium]
MKNLLIALLLFPIILTAQAVKPSTNQINFGNVYEGTTDSVQIVLHNKEPRDLIITGFKFYTIYNKTPFFVKQNNFTIPFQGSQSVWVYFSPKQNILHNSEMIIMHNGTSAYEPIDLIGQGKFSNTYYNSTENLSEEALKTALKTRLGQGYNSLGYNNGRDLIFMTIDNKKTNGQGASVNTLECVYTGTTITGYASRSAAQSGNPQFNTEHTFPQGHFNSNEPMKSDIHHLFPTTNNSNSQRGNKPFGNISGGTASGGGSFYNNTTYEPRDAQKGRTARALMYFVIRYQDYSSHFAGSETVLRQWHNAFPVDAIDRKRNNDIYAAQNNRNPFIDYPQFEERITNFVSNSVAPQSFGLDVLQSSINFGAVIRAQADTFDYVLVNRGNKDILFSNFSLSNTSDFSFAANSGVNSTLLPGEALQISVIVNAANTGTITGNLNFNTNIPGGQSSFVIPISAQSIIVSVDEQSLSNQLSVYPNPMQEKLFIRYEGNEKLDIRLLDAIGKQVELDYVISNGFISTKDLLHGVYFLEIKKGDKRIVKKLVK